MEETGEEARHNLAHLRCEHGKSRCFECKKGLCPHDQRVDRCRECNLHFCAHGRRRHRCRDCGTGMCPCGKIKERCKVCTKKC